MKKDLPINIVTDVAIAIVLMGDTPMENHWNVYLINFKNTALSHVLVSSKGYGNKDGLEVKTSVLRYSLGDVPANSYKAIEAIDAQVFGLTNEYWLSFYEDDGHIYDKKFIFLPETVQDENLMRIPLLNKAGVMIK